MNHVRNNSLHSEKKATKFKISNVMKKNIILLSLFTTFLVFANSSFAIDTKKTPTPTTIDLQQQVNELKSKIASKVAQLNLVEKRSVLGIVTDISDSQITIKNLDEKIRLVDIDELTKFSSSSSDTFGISDIKKGMYLGIIGLFNKQSQRTQARIVQEEDPLPNFIYGSVVSIDNKNFTFEIIKENRVRFVIDVQNITKTYSYTTTGDLVKAGFSKIKEAETIIVVGFFDKQDRNKILGSRIFLFPEISTSPKINLNAPTIAPSTGSGKKLTPIVR